MTLTYRKVFSISFYLSCLAGLYWQSYYICEPYFRYPVNTVISLDWPTSEIPKSINFGIVNHIGGHDNLSYIWEHSPSLDDVTPIGADNFCGLTNSTHDLECDQIIVKKFIFAQSPIYSFTNPFAIKNFDRNDIIYINQKALMILFIKLTNLSESTLAAVYFLTNLNEPPIDVLQRGFTYQRISKQMAYHLDYTNLYVKKLKAPYSDNCVDYKEMKSSNCVSLTSCLTDCISNKTEKYFKAHLLQAIHNPPFKYNERFVISDKNRDSFFNVTKPCLERFTHSDCTTSTVITRSNPIYLADEAYSNLLGFFYEISSRPSTEIISNEQILLIDFVTYILGALGTWLGFSFLGLEDYVDKFKKKDDNSNSKNNEVVESVQPVVDNTRDDELHLQSDKIKLLTTQVRYLKQSNDQSKAEIDELKASFVNFKIQIEDVKRRRRY